MCACAHGGASHRGLNASARDTVVARRDIAQLRRSPSKRSRYQAKGREREPVKAAPSQHHPRGRGESRPRVWSQPARSRSTRGAICSQPRPLGRRASSQTERRWVPLQGLKTQSARERRMRPLALLILPARRGVHRSVGEPAEGSLTRNVHQTLVAALARPQNPPPSSLALVARGLGEPPTHPSCGRPTLPLAPPRRVRRTWPAPPLRGCVEPRSRPMRKLGVARALGPRDRSHGPRPQENLPSMLRSQ